MGAVLNMFRNNIIQSYVLYDIVKTGTNIFIKMEQNTKPAESESDMEFFLIHGSITMVL